MMPVTRILVVRMGRAGDMVMITPALKALAAARPDAEIHLLTGDEGARTLRGFDPSIVRVWRYTRRFPQSWLRQRPLRRDLVAQGFDHVFAFESKPFYREWLGDVGGAFHGLDAGRFRRHFARRCLDLVAEAMEIPVEDRPVWLPVTDAGREKARALLVDAGVDPDGPVVGLHPTFSGSRLPWGRDRRGRRHRHWPAGSWGRLAALLRQHGREAGRPPAVVVDVLPEDRDVLRPLLDEAAGAVTVLSAPPDFERYKALLAGMSALVSANTGPMHMAAAVGTPVVALFSGWDPADCGPFVPADQVTVLRAEDTPRASLGLAALDPADVAAAVASALAGRAT
jgi:heptosyltransferase-1